MDGPRSPGGYGSWRNNKKMKTLIVDADSLMRDGLSALLALRDDIEVIGAVDGVAALTQVPPTTLPELVILDIGIPDYEGSKTLASLRVESAILIIFPENSTAPSTCQPVRNHWQSPPS